jgi:hypothetical protein
MNYFVLADSTIFPLIGAISYSMGEGLETDQKYGYDYSKKPQSLVYRKKNTAKTLTIQMAFTPTYCVEYDKLPMDYVASLEAITGQKIDFYWNRQLVGSFVISQMQFSCNVDVYQLFDSMSVSISMTEGYYRNTQLVNEVSVKVGTLENPNK